MFIPLPPDKSVSVLRRDGFSLAGMISEACPDLERYYNLRPGLKVEGGHVLVREETPIVAHVSPRFGRIPVALARCGQLMSDGKCRIYETRPVTCRNFNAEHAAFYVVPKGCRYDRDGLGEDVNDLTEGKQRRID